MPVDIDMDTVNGSIQELYSKYGSGDGDNADFVTDLSLMLWQASSILQNVPLYSGQGIPNSPEVITPVEVQQLLRSIGDLENMWARRSRKATT